MSKKPSINLSGAISLEPTPTIPGILQRGAEPTQQPAEAKRPVGRPKGEPREGAKRIAVTVDGATYRAVAHACVDMGIDRQTFLERAIALMLKDTAV